MILDVPTLRHVLGHRLVAAPEPPPPPARGVRFHSDRVRPGDAFFALPGAATHGIRFADDALARGAAYVVSDRPHPGAVLVDDAGAALLALGQAARAAREGPVVAVTGSAGKTTTKALLAAALDALVSPGNLNTPHALATVLIDAWLGDDARRPLVLELGIDHPGEMARLTALVRPTHGLVTLIAAAHLASLGDLARVADEKAGVLRTATRGRYASEAAWSRLPADARAGVRRYRLDPAADAGGHPTPVEAGDGTLTRGRHEVRGETELLLADLDGAEVTVALPGVGRALAENALGALRVAVDLGVPPAVAAERLAGATLEPGRLSRNALGPLLLLDDSYNANPASMAVALEVLARGPRPHAAVLGSMLELGSFAHEAHREVGRACADLGLDLLWTVGEDARAIAEAFDAAAGAAAETGAHAVLDAVLDTARGGGAGRDRPGARRLADAPAAVAVAAELPTAGTLLVKGSRGIGLERLVAHLRATREEPS